MYVFVSHGIVTLEVERTREIVTVQIKVGCTLDIFTTR